MAPDKASEGQQHRHYFVPKLSWHTEPLNLTHLCSLKAYRAKIIARLSQPGVREPRVNRGRLRHCIGIQLPKSHCPAYRYEGRVGRRERGLCPESGYRPGCARPVATQAATSPQREG